MGRLRILLVDDHVLLREALRSVIHQLSDMDVVGEAGDGAEAVKIAGRLLPDVILLDMRMPGLSGPEAIRQLKLASPASKILVMSSDEEAAARPMLSAGAEGFVPKSSGPDELLHAIQQVVSGAGGLPAGSAGAPRALTLEEQVLHRFAQGHPLKRIATALGLDVATVEQHREQGMRRLGLKTRADVARLAAERGWG